MMNPHRKLRGEECLCTTCGWFFSGERSFDAHRTGPYGDPANPRRCKTGAEMTAPKPKAALAFDAAKDHWGSAIKNDFWARQRAKTATKVPSVG